jgi:plastocyanin
MRHQLGFDKRVRIFSLMAIVGLALMLVACGGGDTDSSGSDGPTVNIEELPGTVIVLEGDKCPPVFAKAGDEITWLNSSGGPLVVRERDAVGGSDFDSGSLQPGESYTYAFPQFGSYGYECSEDGAHKGSVTVSP